MLCTFSDQCYRDNRHIHSFPTRRSSDLNYESKNINIQKAQNIIQKLMITLNQELEISKQILPIYEFIIFQLREANIKNDISHLETALEFVIEFRDTWKDLMKQEVKGNYVQGAKV